MRVQRIAVCGSAGTGKSTLANTLATRFGYPLIPDRIDDVLRALGYQSWLQVPSEAAVRLRFEALLLKIEDETANEAFVSDKCVVDYLGYWNLNTAPKASAGDRQRFRALVDSHVARYDLMLLLPWGRRPIDPVPRRYENPEHQLRVQSSIVQAMAELRAPVMPFDPWKEKVAQRAVEAIGKWSQRGRRQGEHQVGLFVGTFDPPTKGHISCAVRALEVCDEVWFCPNPDNPTAVRRHVGLERRAEMLRLAMAEETRMRVYLSEHNPYLPYLEDRRTTGRRTGLLTEVKAKWPDVRFWVMMGSDKLSTPVYQEPEHELAEVGHIVCERSGAMNRDALAKLDWWIVLWNVGSGSSSEVKARLSRGEAVWDLVPRAVGEYIADHDLYGATGVSRS